MRLIVDTNQVAAICRTPPTNSINPTLVIPPLVWSEIMRSRAYGQQRALALTEYDVMFGVDISKMLEDMAAATEHQIRRTTPVYRTISEAHQFLMEGFTNPTEKHFERAEELKREADAFAEEVRERARKDNKKYNDLKSRGERLDFVKWTTIEDAEALLVADETSTWAERTIEMITESDTRPLKAVSKASLHAAIMDNPSLRLWTRVAITQSFGYRDCWTDQTLNNTPAGNDLTDVSITFYARPGDAILTAERRLKRAIEHSDPDSQFDVVTWDEYKAMREKQLSDRR